VLEPIAWLILAAVHAMPAIAFFRPALLTRLYRLPADNPLFLLMHHRAAMFFAVFSICIWATFDPKSRQLATIAVGISMMSFLALYWRTGSPNPLKKIARVDIMGLPVLTYAGWMAFAV
jgi:hypothetical protein